VHVVLLAIMIGNDSHLTATATLPVGLHPHKVVIGTLASVAESIVKGVHEL
jgi:hypothetical protein